MENEYIRRIAKKAEELSIGIVLTAFTPGKQKPRYSAFLMDKKGRILIRYDKVHTCDFSDEASLESGERFYTANFHGIKLGIMICYDREYPESARVLMMRAAPVLFLLFAGIRMGTVLRMRSLWQRKRKKGFTWLIIQWKSCERTAAAR